MSTVREDLPIALGVLALVPAVWSTACPPLSTVRGSLDAGGHVAAGIGQAAALSGLLVGAVVLASGGSPTVAVLGASVVLVYAGLYLHAREVNP